MTPKEKTVNASTATATATTSPLRKRGFCHVFGDNIPLDEGIMAFKFAIGRVTDPQVLIPHLFELIDPEFVHRVKPGDLVIAGTDFASGKPHLTGFIAMQALGMGVLCESMPARALRGAVSKGLPVLSRCEDIRSFVQAGDELDIDFETGVAHNVTRGTHRTFPGMPPILRDIVAMGGTVGKLRSWLDAHPEQRASAASPSLEGPPPGYAAVQLTRGARS